ncbi:MAG: hypothetical protein V1902_02355 [Candidatus Falkowbacteria bacterium]
MNETTRNMLKVGVACFIGAVVLYVVALLLAPAFKFLCLIAGFGAGYMAYEFRKVLVAIPGALRSAWKETRHMLAGLRRNTKKAWKNALNAKPEIWISIILSFIAVTVLIVAYDYGPIFNNQPRTYDIPDIIGIILAYLITYGVIGGACMAILFMFVWSFNLAGWEHYKILLYPPDAIDLPIGYVYINYDDLPIKERWKTCLCGIYTGIFRLFYWIGWLLYKAAFWIVAFVFCYMWVGLAYGILYALGGIAWAISFVTSFIVSLMLAIHKKERLICAIDGTLGGIVAWIHLSPIVTASTADHILPMLCGGILGALVGMINYRLVAVSLLKFLPASA